MTKSFCKKFCFVYIFLGFLLAFSAQVRGGIREVKLQNGLTVLLKEDHRLPIVAIQLWVKTGSKNEDTVTSGISHLIEHMLFKDTKNYPREKIYDEVEKRGGIINAGTSRDFTYFYITFPTRVGIGPDIHQDVLSIGLDILSQMAGSALFLEEELEREKSVILEEITRKFDDPRSYLWDLFNFSLYSGHPYSQPVLGTKESVGNLSKEEVVEYYRRFYILANFTFVIVGDFKERDAIKLVQNLFGKKGNFPQPSLNLKHEHSRREELKIKQTKNLEVRRPVRQVYMILGTIGPDVVDDDCYSMDVISYILGKGRYSSLYRKLREGKLAWSINCSFLTQKEKGPFYIYVECDTDKISVVKEIIFQELERISSQLVSEDEIKRAKALFESEYLLDAETYSGEAFNLGYYQTICSYKVALKYLEKILRVNTKDIQRVSRKYLSPENFICIIIKPEG